MFSGNCCQDESDWTNFVSELTDRQEVCIQVFQPYQVGILSEHHECWKLYKGVFNKPRPYPTVSYNNNESACKEGILTYWDFEKEQGKCFTSRIVRWSTEIGVLMGDRSCFESYRPIYEPDWGCVSYFLDKFGPDHGKVRQELKSISKNQYSYTVANGSIHKVFSPNYNELHETIPGFLYYQELPT